MPRRVKVMKMVEEDIAASYGAIVEAAIDTEDTTDESVCGSPEVVRPQPDENCDDVNQSETVDNECHEDVRHVKPKRTPKRKHLYNTKISLMLLNAACLLHLLKIKSLLYQKMRNTRKER